MRMLVPVAALMIGGSLLADPKSLPAGPVASCASELRVVSTTCDFKDDWSEYDLWCGTPDPVPDNFASLWDACMVRLGAAASQADRVLHPLTDDYEIIDRRLYSVSGEPWLVLFHETGGRLVVAHSAVDPAGVLTMRDLPADLHPVRGFSPLPAGGPVAAGKFGVTTPKILSKTQPPYPEKARKKRLQGTVVLLGVVRADGAVDRIRVLKSTTPDAGFEAAAIRCLEQWRFEPARLHGEPIDVHWVVNMDFEMFGPPR